MGFSFSEHRLIHQMQNPSEQPQNVPQQPSSPESVVKMQNAAEQQTNEQRTKLYRSVNASRNRLGQSNILQATQQLERQFQQELLTWLSQRGISAQVAQLRIQQDRNFQQEVFAFKQQFAARVSPEFERQTGFRVNPGDPEDRIFGIGLDRPESPYRPLTPSENAVMQRITPEYGQLVNNLFITTIVRFRRYPTSQELFAFKQQYCDNVNSYMDSLNDPTITMRLYAGLPNNHRLLTDYNGSIWEQRKQNAPNPAPINLATPLRTSAPAPAGNNASLDLSRIGMAATGASGSAETPVSRENLQRVESVLTRNRIPESGRKYVQDWLGSVREGQAGSIPSAIQATFLNLPPNTRTEFLNEVNKYLLEFRREVTANTAGILQMRQR